MNLGKASDARHKAAGPSKPPAGPGEMPKPPASAPPARKDDPTPKPPAGPGKFPDTPAGAAVDSDMATAYHEAGHAVVAVALRMRVGSATIEPAGDYLGRVQTPLTDAQLETIEFGDGRGLIDRHIACLFAGSVAEARVTGHVNHDGARQDYDTAFCFAFQFASYQETLDRGHAKAGDLITEHWAAVAAVAEGLLASRTLSSARLRAIIRASQWAPADAPGRGKR